MRALGIVMVLAACGNDPKVCVPDGPFAWPASCDQLDCRGVTCDVTCEAGNSCDRLDCTGSPQCRLDCQPMATCADLDCRSTGACFADCEDNSTCDVSCAGSTSCGVECRTGSKCLLDCGSTPATSCKFDVCDAPTSCGGGVIACNRACPT